MNSLAAFWVGFFAGMIWIVSVLSWMAWAALFKPTPKSKSGRPLGMDDRRHFYMNRN